jgi:NADPH:quinone reductase-like Zn-dependent oxidoreductase
MIEAGQVAPVISCTVPFAAIPAALDAAAQGHTRGKVGVIIRGHGAQP